MIIITMFAFSTISLIASSVCIYAASDYKGNEEHCLTLMAACLLLAMPAAATLHLTMVVAEFGTLQSGTTLLTIALSVFAAFVGVGIAIHAKRGIRSNKANAQHSA